MVESFDPDDQAMLACHQSVLQLSHLSFVGWLRQVVTQNVYQQVKQHDTGGQKKKGEDWKNETSLKQRT